jgi:tetratricopeptide (TPR) repeat protein
MLRGIVLAATLGALVAGGAAHTIRPPRWIAGIEPWVPELDLRTKTAIALESLPICTTLTSVGSDADWVKLEPDFRAGKKALGAQDWQSAITAFEQAALRDPLNADIHNYIGYAYRRLRQVEPAVGHFQQALALNPRHRGARQHLGEVYLVLGEPAKAEQLLAELENLCLISCAEYEDLKQAIASYENLAAR